MTPARALIHIGDWRFQLVSESRIGRASTALSTISVVWVPSGPLVVQLPAHWGLSGGSGLAGFSFTGVPLAQPGAPGLPLQRQDHCSFLSLPGAGAPTPGPLRVQTVLAVPCGWPRAFPASHSRNQQSPQSSPRARALAPGPHASP